MGVHYKPGVTVNLPNDTTALTIAQRQRDLNLNPNQLYYLLNFVWLKERNNVIVRGAAGTGKTDLLCGVADAAAQQRIRCYYDDYFFLCSHLKILMSKDNYGYQQEIKKIARNKIVIIDDFGGTHAPEFSLVIKNLLDEFTKNGTCLLISSQQGAKQWHENLGGNLYADLVCDRIVNRAIYIDLQGNSRRLPKGNIGDLTFSMESADLNES